MAELNEVRLIGRLTRDVETRLTQSGLNIASWGLATSRKMKDKEETLFIEIVCFGKTADIAGKWLTKGSQIYVGGRLKLDQWEDKHTGVKRSKISVIAQNIQFLDKKGTEQKMTPPNSVQPTQQSSYECDNDYPPASMGEPPF